MRPAIVPSSSPMHELNQGVTVVTGGAGLIGSAVIWGINNQNQENIWLVDEREDDSLKKRNLEHLCFRRILGLGEFRSLVSQKSPELSEIRTIIHLGACSSTTETDEDYLHDNNFLYTKELCEWSLCNGVRFVYASSAATYGDGTLGMDDKDEETPAPDPHDGGSMRGEKMAFIPSRSPDVEPSATIFNAGARHEAEEARPGRGRPAPARRIDRRARDPHRGRAERFIHHRRRSVRLRRNTSV